jgi:hypothetical protein
MLPRGCRRHRATRSSRRREALDSQLLKGVAGKVEEIGDGIMDRDEALQLPRRFEPLHDPLSPPRWPMRILRAIVEPFMLAMLERHAHGHARRAVGTKLIGDQDTRSAGLFAYEFAKQAFGGASVAAALNQSVEDEAVPIDGAPKPVFLAIDGDHDLIDVPFVAELRRAPAHFVGEVPAEFLGPPPDGFVTDDHTAGGQEIFDHSQAERETEIEPNRMGDDLSRKAMTTIAGM